MNTHFIKRLLSLTILVLIAVLALSFTACDNDGNKNFEIYIEKNDLPRQTYVQGQELDLKGGVLTTVSNGEKAPIPLDSEGVTVSGYNKDTVGSQTVTVTYNEATTTFTVNVIARASAENYESRYFVGDAFDKTKGKLRIAKDNGETFVVNMSDRYS